MTDDAKRIGLIVLVVVVVVVAVWSAVRSMHSGAGGVPASQAQEFAEKMRQSYKAGNTGGNLGPGGKPLPPGMRPPGPSTPGGGSGAPP